MGCDCTLHAVDEKDIKGKFVRALLVGTKPPKGFTDDHGYELLNAQFKDSFSLVKGDGIDDWASVPTNHDGFFYLSRRCLFEIHRGGTSISHLPKLINIMQIQPGPQRSLLLKEGDNKAGDWGKLYWPKTKEMVRLKPDLLPDVDPEDLCAFYWLEEKQRLLVFTAEEVWYIPWDEIEKLPREKI